MTRPAWSVLAAASGLVIWALHFTTIYALNAVACETGGRDPRLLVGLATLAALLPLAWLLRREGLRLGAPLDEGGEAAPRFLRWFTAAAAAYAILAVLFQAAPALVIPPCGIGY